MKLTGRQQAFLGDFLDLYQEEKDSLHYTTVAERLGIGRITAYDMLRLLEEKGLVTSEYIVPAGGPGRPSAVRVHRRCDAHLGGLRPQRIFLKYFFVFFVFF